MSGHILVTGATGALGTGVMVRLLETLPDTRFTILTRRPGQGAAHPRVEELRCDLMADGWTELLPRRLAQTLTGVLHMAADVRWNVSAVEALNMNTRVCARLADWASHNCHKLEHFCYVSTAYVEAPSHLKGAPGFFEHEGRVFNNSYEFSKSMGEREVLARSLPSVIVRPSLIVGDSRTGQIGRFNGLYTVLRFASQGLLPIVAGNRQAYVDIVTLDTVVKAVQLAFGRRPEPAGQIVWAISGAMSPKVEDVMNVSFQGLNAFRRQRGASAIDMPAVVPYDTYRRLYKPWFEQQASAIQKRIMEYLDVYTPYFSVTDVFRPEAGHTVVQSPDWRLALPRIVEHWCEANDIMALKPLRRWERSSNTIAS
ncbi:SDR family oxidoreductase [Aquabacterium sp. A7-Y]|uniref:SDR family oxidoreductase n=1 Tax=Aquabacterium sp. A7-Y TaxID=1349605 RepID=UPI00223DF126|nr:SDR family oxidoreductase [Aquabacterium sp. A7-Y]MCW7536771.1 SDR family oxidoreductase [Aquabacterium sp. A7-Y]